METQYWGMYFAFLDLIAVELHKQCSTVGSPDFTTCVKPEQGVISC